MARTNKQALAPTIREVHELDARKDLYICLPTTKESDGGKAQQHYLHIRSRPTDAAPDAGNIVKTANGLGKFIMKFNDVWITHIRAFGQTGDNGAQESVGEQQKVTMGIALSDGRVGPTEREADIISRLDDTTDFLRKQMILNADIRTTLNIAGGGKKDVTEENADMYAEFLDSINISKPLRGSPDMDAETRRYPTRYIYPTVRLDGWFKTHFWTPDGTRIPIALARSWGRGCEAPTVLVELESIFCNKLIKAVQMRVVEAVLVPPDVQPHKRLRTSLIFPGVSCEEEDSAEASALPSMPVATDVQQPLSITTGYSQSIDSATADVSSTEEPAVSDLSKKADEDLKKKRKRLTE